MTTKTEQTKIRSGWREVRLGDVCDINPEQIDPKKYPEKKFKYIDIASVREFSIQDDKFFEGKTSPSRARRIVRENDIIVSTVRPNLRAVSLVNNKFQGCVVSTGFCVLRAVQEEAVPGFIYSVIISDDFTSYLVNKTVGSNYPAVNASEIAEYELLLPPLKEQQKIAEILLSVDAEIGKVNEVVTKTERLKKGLMRELFTRGIGHTKFKKTEIGQIPEVWEVEKIGGHIIHVGSGATPRGGSKVYLTEGVPFIRSQNVYFEGLIQEDLVYISEQTHEEMSRSKTLPNDVLLNITGASIGRACIVPAGLLDANVNQHVCIIRPSKNLLYKYLFYFLQSDSGQNQIFKFQIGGNREGLNFQQIRSIEFPCTKDVEEQKQITNILSAVDEKIKINKQIKQKLTTLKTGLMQDLLSG